METRDSAGGRPEWAALRSIAFIGNYLPRKCGIATFTTHLLESVAANVPDAECWAVAMDDHPESYDYSPQVHLRIPQNSLSEYSLAADRINHSQADVVCLQHEFGIFGGQQGSFVIELLRELRMPVVTTLHTILREPGPQHLKIITQLSDLSDRIVVMSERSVDYLREIYGVTQEKIVLIPHGIPDVPFVNPDTFKEKYGLTGKRVIMTFGLLSPDKGIETVIDALPEIVRLHPQVVYMIVGATHPHYKADHGEDYRISLHLRAKKSGVEDHVIFHDHFVSEAELIHFIGAADIYVTPYLKEEQIVSGTLAYALGAGKAVISTPNWYAQELLAGGRGRLFPFRDSEALARHVIDLLDHPDELLAVRGRAYAYGRQMIWSHVGGQYLDTFVKAKNRRLRIKPESGREGAVPRRPQPLPEINLAHLVRMTDGTGILQHAKYSVPDRKYGYCVDDNARALIVAVMVHDLHRRDSSMVNFINVYLSFLDHAFNHKNGRFRNFLSYDRCWLEESGSEDSYGRALWGLGVAVALGRNPTQVGFAADLFRHALDTAENFESPRAAAFAVIGAHGYLRRHQEDVRASEICEHLSARLMSWYRDTASSDWPWFENTLTYDNARLPQALLLSGRLFGQTGMLETGLSALTWLQTIQTDPLGRHFSAIGNHGWFSRNRERAQFDQQPIEAAAMVDACLEAYQCTRDKNWENSAYQCLNWYLGENDLHASLYDHSTGGCRDGLGAGTVNVNQGAESTLCWLMALLAVYNHRS